MFFPPFFFSQSNSRVREDCDFLYQIRDKSKGIFGCCKYVLLKNKYKKRVGISQNITSLLFFFIKSYQLALTTPSSFTCLLAEKLGVPSETVQNGVQGMMYLMTESSKLLMNDLDFHDSVIILGYPADLNELLLKVHQSFDSV